MYAVRNKKSKKIIHLNPAPLSQKLTGRQVYANFDSQTMEIGKTDGPLPEHFHIKKGYIVEYTLEEQVKEGFLELDPKEKIENNQIVEKTLQERVNEGLEELDPAYKIENNQMVLKSLEEQAKEGLIEIGPNQKIENNQIVQKSLKEQLKEGLFELNEPFQYLEDNMVKNHTVQEVIAKKLLTKKEHCAKALQALDVEIIKEIAQQYSAGEEIKRTKNYIDWIEAGKPDNDEREAQYREMQADIADIKAEYKPLKEQVQKVLGKL